MKYLLDAMQMKAIDTHSIQDIGIPSMVLMERAAYAVTNKVAEVLLSQNCRKIPKVLCVCGKGNNGADGLAVARQLQERGICSEICITGNMEKAGTQEFEQQLLICKRLGIVICNNPEYSEYTVIVDAIFGIGLSRDVQGSYADRIRKINEARDANGCRVIAVDIASGVNATDGSIMGAAVCADDTVTFGYQKLGMCFYPGADYSGNIEVAQVGFAPLESEPQKNYVFTYTDADLCAIPKRRADGNKGTFGKVAVIAGSDDMGGAACMSSLAAYRSGSGLVKVLTVGENKQLVLSKVPEAIFEKLECPCEAENRMKIQQTDAVEHFDRQSDAEFERQDAYYKNRIQDIFRWADCIIVGPGLSQDIRAELIVKHVMEEIIQDEKDNCVIFDADALNVIAKNEMLQTMLKTYKMQQDCKTGIQKIIMTPHMGEMSRLCKKEIAGIKKNPIAVARQFAKEYGVICVLKDARTIVTDGEQTFLNMSGNAGMATGGSGDVLTGVIAGMVLAGDAAKDTQLLKYAAYGVYLHGRAGDFAKEMYTEYGMTAMNIAQMLPKAFQRGCEI